MTAFGFEPFFDFFEQDDRIALIFFEPVFDQLHCPLYSGIAIFSSALTFRMVFFTSLAETHDGQFELGNAPHLIEGLFEMLDGIVDIKMGIQRAEIG